MTTNWIEPISSEEEKAQRLAAPRDRFGNITVRCLWCGQEEKHYYSGVLRSCAICHATGMRGRVFEIITEKP